MSSLRVSNGYTSNNLDFDVETELNSSSQNRQIIAISKQYMFSDSETSTSTKYYGFVTRTGAWMIMRKTGTTAEAVRYAAGTANYTTAWTARTSQTYNYYHLTFPAS